MRIRPLKKHPKRLENLYLVNYCAHAFKRNLNQWLDEYSDRISPKALNELILIMKHFKILGDFEKI